MTSGHLETNLFWKNRFILLVEGEERLLHSWKVLLQGRGDAMPTKTVKKKLVPRSVVERAFLGKIHPFRVQSLTHSQHVSTKSCPKAHTSSTPILQATPAGGQAVVSNLPEATGRKLLAVIRVFSICFVSQVVIPLLANILFDPGASCETRWRRSRRSCTTLT